MFKSELETLSNELKNKIKSDYNGKQTDPYRQGRKHEAEAILFRVEALLYSARMKACSKAMLGGKI